MDSGACSGTGAQWSLLPGTTAGTARLGAGGTAAVPLLLLLQAVPLLQEALLGGCGWPGAGSGAAAAGGTAGCGAQVGGAGCGTNAGFTVGRCTNSGQGAKRVVALP